MAAQALPKKRLPESTLSQSALRQSPFCYLQYQRRSHETPIKPDLPWFVNPYKSVEVVLVGGSHLSRLLWFCPGIASQLPQNIMLAAMDDPIAKLQYRLELPNGILFELQQRNETRKIVFMAGSRDILPTTDDASSPEPAVNLDSVVGRVGQILESIRLYLPAVQIEVWGLPRDAQNHPNIAVFNQKLAHLCVRHKVQYRGDVFEASCQTPDLWLEDGYHLNVRGYQTCILPAVVAAARIV